MLMISPSLSLRPSYSTCERKEIMSSFGFARFSSIWDWM